MEDRTVTDVDAGWETAMSPDPGGRPAPVVYREVAQLWSLDLRTDVVTTSASGATRPVSIPRSDWLEAVHPESRAGVDIMLDTLARTPECEVGVKLRLREGSGYRLVDLRCRGLRLGGDDVELIHGALTPVGHTDESTTPRSAAREAFEFRIKAVVSMVRSLARRSLETSETVDDFAASFDGRLCAMSEAQLMLARSNDGVIDLEALVREELTRTAAMEAEKAALAGPPVRLPARSAELLALAIHELAVNALKFGALADESASLAVAWRIERAGSVSRLVFDWTEGGVIIDSGPLHQGFGTELIEAGLPYEIDALTRLEFRPDGVHCQISIPLAVSALGV